MNLVDVEKRLPSQLPGGQQQRVALARALVMKPQVILFDEPLSNLDAKLRGQMRIEIRRLQQRLGITSIYVTHDQAEAMSMWDSIVVMNQGRIEQVGRPSDVYLRPASVFVADFIGHASFVETQVNRRQDDQATVDVLGKIEVGDQVLTVVDYAPRPDGLFGEGCQVGVSFDESRSYLLPRELAPRRSQN